LTPFTNARTIEPKNDITTTMLRLYPTLIGAVLAFGTPMLCVLATVAFGELCWPQRIGAVYVGASVFLQGFLAADPDRLNRTLTDGVPLRGHINQVNFVLAIFGTLFAAFGDLLPSIFYYGIPMCTA
jgi:hypothetical protein